LTRSLRVSDRTALTTRRRWFRVFSRYNGNFVKRGPSDQSRRCGRDGRRAAVAGRLILTVGGGRGEVGHDFGDVFDRRASRVRGSSRGFDRCSDRIRMAGRRFRLGSRGRRGRLGRRLRLGLLRGRSDCRRRCRGRCRRRFVGGARRFDDGFGGGEQGRHGGVVLLTGTSRRYRGVRLTGRGGLRGRRRSVRRAGCRGGNAELDRRSRGLGLWLLGGGRGDGGCGRGRGGLVSDRQRSVRGRLDHWLGRGESG